MVLAAEQQEILPWDGSGGVLLCDVEGGLAAQRRRDCAWRSHGHGASGAVHGYYRTWPESDPPWWCRSVQLHHCKSSPLGPCRGAKRCSLHCRTLAGQPANTGQVHCCNTAAVQLNHNGRSRFSILPQPSRSSTQQHHIGSAAKVKFALQCANLATVQTKLLHQTAPLFACSESRNKPPRPHPKSHSKIHPYWPAHVNLTDVGLCKQQVGGATGRPAAPKVIEGKAHERPVHMGQVLNPADRSRDGVLVHVEATCANAEQGVTRLADFSRGIPRHAGKLYATFKDLAAHGFSCFL
jgi:hypothetical protein